MNLPYAASSIVLCLAALALVPAEAQAKGPKPTKFDDIKFDIEKDGEFKPEMLTEQIKALNNEDIAIRGYILPNSVLKQTGIKQFVLVRDNQECCFGPGAALYDCIIVEMTEKHSASFTTRPVTVEGRFTIEEYKFGDKVLAIYHLDGVKVK